MTTATTTTTAKSNGKNKGATAIKTTKAGATKTRNTAAGKTVSKRKTSGTAASKTVRKPASKRAKTMKVGQSQVISYQTRYQMIQEAAYHIAEKQAFNPDNELAHWLEAETQIDQWIQTENIQLSS